jgi:ABC-type polysaccharide/polyol phosphate transport system ATPase subunit
MASIKLENISVDVFDCSSKNFSFKSFIMGGDGIYPKKKRILTDISLHVNNNEVIGIYGKNGAGKTTLLRVISGIIPISRGKLSIDGSCLPILGLGNIFHGDLDVFDNIRLWNASFKSKFIVDQKFVNEIISKAEIDVKPHQLIRSFSSGMLSKLSFELAMSHDADIFLLDEIFSVGDESFKIKSKSRILDKIKGSGCTIMTSHDINLLKDICDKILFFEENGKTRISNV